MLEATERKRDAMAFRLATGTADASVVGLDVNERGTPISVHVCTYCGDRFTVCPPAGPNFGTGCLAPLCPSYDIERDVEYLLAAGQTLVREGDDGR